MARCASTKCSRGSGTFVWGLVFLSLRNFPQGRRYLFCWKLVELYGVLEMRYCSSQEEYSMLGRLCIS